MSYARKRLNKEKLRLWGHLESDSYIAVSGGVDSVVMAHLAIESKREEKSKASAPNEKLPSIAFFHHGNALADQELSFVTNFAKSLGVELLVGRSEIPVAEGASKEKHWRDERYEFFKSLGGQVMTGHNLDDAVEWYLMTCLRGRGEFMPYRHTNVVRPLLLSKKSVIEKYAQEKNLPFFQDNTNQDPEFTARNRVRHDVLPQCLMINQGLYTVVKNRIMDKEQKIETKKSWFLG